MPRAEGATMFCRQCGTERDPGHRFCVRCGKPVTEATRDDGPPDEATTDEAAVREPSPYDRNGEAPTYDAAPPWSPVAAAGGPRGSHQPVLVAAALLGGLALIGGAVVGTLALTRDDGVSAAPTPTSLTPPPPPASTTAPTPTPVSTSSAPVVPSPTAAASPRVVDAGLLAVDDQSGDPSGPVVADALRRYMGGINDRAYDRAYATLSTKAQKRTSRQDLENGSEGSTFVDIVLGTVSRSGGSLEVLTHFTTQQDARHGVNGQTCSRWDLTYAMVPGPAGSLLIDRATPGAGSPTDCQDESDY